MTPRRLRHKWRSRFLLVGKLVVAAILFYWLISSDRLQFGRLWAVSSGFGAFLLAFLVLASMALPVVRWWWLLRIQRIDEPFLNVAAVTWGGYFTSLLLPGAASGDLARGYLILRPRSGARARAVSTVLLDRFLGLQSMFFIGSLSAIGMLFISGHGKFFLSLFALTVGPFLAMTGGLAALLIQPLRKVLFRIMPSTWRTAWHQSFELYREGIFGVLGCFGLAILSSLLTVLSLGFAGSLLNEQTSWLATVLLTPLIVTANSLPITPGGLGFAEFVSSGLFSGFGVSCGAEMMLLVRILGAALSLPGLSVFLFPARLGRENNKTNPIHDHVCG